MLAQKNKSSLFIRRTNLAPVKQPVSQKSATRQLSPVKEKTVAIPAKGYIKPPKHDFL